MKLSARVIVAAAAVLTFLASCGQLLGDWEIVRIPPEQTEELPLLPICTLGATQCEGRLLQLCVEEGTAWTTLEPCATAELCESSDVSTVSSCIKPACSAEQMSCDGANLLLCNAARNGWEAFATCESAAHCDAGNRQCLAAPCEPGARRCNIGYLERCNDASTAWEPLDTCVTNDLCEQTLAPPAVVGEILTTGQVPTPPPSNAEGPISCRQPECVPREVRCELSRLNACNEGQTALELAEECATPKLCDASITYTGLRGSPRCVRAACAAGEHRCSTEGVLELCNADRDGFDPIEACIGAPFCNAVAADNGLPGCEAAPCDPGEEQCNGPQVQRCLPDQTGFEAVGPACETRGLCNDDNSPAFCAPAVCQRGPFSGSEFRCQGATLQRCNDQHTGYDTLSSCATPGLCNAGFGFNGCQPPVCDPGETQCSGNFVQVCNEQRTAFVNVEQCAQGTCDSAAGRCADPCIEGTGRCNAQGNLEECRNRLTGWEITARCGSVQLCDPGARACRAPPAGCTADGVRRCRTQGGGSVLEVCSDGRSRFSTLDTCEAGEFCDANDVTCDACIAGSEPTCSGNQLVSCSTDGKTDIVQPCANGCQTVANGPDRCRTCVPGSVSCSGEQLVVCRQRGSEEFLDREDCDSDALCQNTVAACNANGDGQNCRCAPGACSPGDRDCNGSQPVICNADQTALIANGADCGLEENCNGAPTGACFACRAGDIRCGADGIMEGCSPDRSGFADLPSSPLPGVVRCIEDNQGALAQSCRGAQLINEDCESDICEEGVGCAECNPDPGAFPPVCATPTALTTCENGDIVTTECGGGAAACTTGACTGGRCIIAQVERGTPCAGGFCGGTSQPGCVLECVNDGNCDDGVECTTDSCDLARGVCNNAPNNTFCGGDANGNFCTGSNRCDPNAASGTGCVNTPAEVCPDDDNPCTTATCDPVGGVCGQAANTDACDINNQAGTCSNRVCQPNRVCVPGNVCNGPNLERCSADGLTLDVDECASAALCSPMGCITPCDEAGCGNVGCNDARTACNTCVPSLCADDDPCSQETCNGNSCSSGPGCGEGQECVGTACRPIPVGCAADQGFCPDDGNPCNGVEVCDLVSGNCSPNNIGPNCPDGQQCNPQNGQCEGEPPVETPTNTVGCAANQGFCPDDGNPCNGVEVCDFVSGNCSPNNIGPSCPDGQQCNPQNGQCEGGQPPVETPTNPGGNNNGNNNGGGNGGGQPQPPPPVAEPEPPPPVAEPEPPPPVAEPEPPPPVAEPEAPPAEPPVVEAPPAEPPVVEAPPAEPPSTDDGQTDDQATGDPVTPAEGEAAPNGAG